MYNGRYGNLSTMDAAQKSLQEIANNCTWDDLNKATNDKIPVADRYMAGRLLKTIEGLQMVISKNGGIHPVTWLPLLYRTEPIEGKVAVTVMPDKKMISYANKDD